MFFKLNVISIFSLNVLLGSPSDTPIHGRTYSPCSSNIIATSSNKLVGMTSAGPEANLASTVPEAIRSIKVATKP